MDNVGITLKNILKYQTVKLADKADPQEMILKEKVAEKNSVVDEGQDTGDQPAVQEIEVENGAE